MINRLQDCKTKFYTCVGNRTDKAMPCLYNVLLSYAEPQNRRTAELLNSKTAKLQNCKTISSLVPRPLSLLNRLQLNVSYFCKIPGVEK
jgi:hypothetical protein